MSDSIHIVLASDNHYAPLVAALIKSIEVNHLTDELIQLYVIDDGITDSNKQRITASVTSGKTRLHWHSSKTVVPPSVTIPVDKSAFPMTTYMRLFAPYVVPADADRYIYLDVDTMVLHDIAELWHTDLQGKLFGAVLDFQETVSCSWGGIPNYKELGIDPETKYFNAGILLIDKRRWLDADVTNRVIQCLSDNAKYVNYADQYGLNVVLHNQWVELDPRWNWFARTAHPDPYIVHFLDVKPIFTTYASDARFQQLFFSYLNQTPWKNFKPINGNNRFARKLYNKAKKLLMHYTGGLRAGVASAKA